MRYWHLIGLVSLLFCFGCEPEGSYERGKKEGYEAGTNANAANKQQVLEEGYKQGQIDCLNGIVKYRLTENADHTLSWQSVVAKNQTANQPVLISRRRGACDMPILHPVSDGHGGFVYVPLQELGEKVEK